MSRALTIFVVVLSFALPVSAKGLRGNYLEMRTCDIYTGPCFANSEVSLAGEEAILAWNVEQGSFDGVDLAGLSVVMAVKGNDTLGFGGAMEVNPEPVRSVVLVDEKGTPDQRAALLAFARKSAGATAGDVVRVETAPIDMSLDHVKMIGQLRAGNSVAVLTRKLEKFDHCCTNEIVFYPPLAAVENAAPAFTIEGEFSGRGLGLQWAHPRSRSAFLATFAQ